MYSALVTAISNMLAKFFELKITGIENQAQSSVIEDKRDYKKATDIAEKIIEIAQKSVGTLENSGLRRFCLCKKTGRSRNGRCKNLTNGKCFAIIPTVTNP